MVKKSKIVPNMYKKAFESVALKLLAVLKVKLVMKMLLLN